VLEAPGFLKIVDFLTKRKVKITLIFLFAGGRFREKKNCRIFSQDLLGKNR
jgi:hypothetical protein